MKQKRLQLYPELTAPSLEQVGYARERLMLECWRREKDVLMRAKRGARYATEKMQTGSQRGRGVNWIYGREEPGQTGTGKEGGRERDRDTTPGSGETGEGRGLRQ